MLKKFTKIALLSSAALSVMGLEAYAASTTWNVSLWGKRRAFTEHVEKLAELVETKTNGTATRTQQLLFLNCHS